MGFFELMDSTEKMFWYIAIPTSIVFIIQTIMTFIGGDSGDGVNADFDGDLEGVDSPFQLFSLRNLINFLIGFSWTGISFYNKLDNKAILIGLALMVGIAFVALFFILIRQIQKLAENNSFQIKNTIGKTGTVYIRIPAEKSGSGKVQLSVNGTTHELNAVSNQEEIPSGKMIRVIEVLDDNLLLVSPL